jgi:hypothetical protein
LLLPLLSEAFLQIAQPLEALVLPTQAALEQVA